MDKNGILAIVLTIAILIAWNMYFQKSKKNVVPEHERKVIEKVIENIKPVISGTEKDFNIEKGDVTYTFNSRGGSVRQIEIKKYRLPKDKGFVKLVDFYSVTNYPLRLSDETPGNHSEISIANYQTSGIKEEKIKFSYKTKGGYKEESGKWQKSKYIHRGITITKEYDILSEYLMKLSINIKNNSSIPLKEDDNRIIYLNWEPLIGPLLKMGRYDYTSAYYYKDDKLETVKKLKPGGCIPSGNSKGIPKFIENPEWVGISSRYFLITIVPQSMSKSRKGIFRYKAKEGYSVGVGSYLNKLDPGESYNVSFVIYAGPKDREVLEQLRKNFPDNRLLKIDEATKSNVWPWLREIGNLLFKILKFINSIVNNYGISIILLTIFIKVIFYPITHKQFESMAKMQKIQPAINNLKEQYKDEPQKMNQEMMRLYKKHKVNPFGGCLPLLIQIPVFIAFYQTLMVSIELWNSSFLWIWSLAYPDTVWSYGNFNLNILPLIMAATTLVQQKVSSPGGQNTSQAKMFAFLPLIFLFIFWNMPSGLVLYWTVQNILTIVQQIFINKKNNQTETA